MSCYSFDLNTVNDYCLVHDFRLTLQKSGHSIICSLLWNWPVFSKIEWVQRLLYPSVHQYSKQQVCCHSGFSLCCPLDRTHIHTVSRVTAGSCSHSKNFKGNASKLQRRSSLSRFGSHDYILE